MVLSELPKDSRKVGDLAPMRCLPLGVGFLLLSALVACGSVAEPPGDNNEEGFVQGPPRPPPGAAESGTIGSEGGQVELDGAKVDLPPGAVDGDVEIVVSVDATYPDDVGGSSFSAVYDFQPDGIAFDVPIRVELPFTGDANNAVIFWSSELDPTIFEAIETTIENQRAVAYVSHFSKGVVRNKCLAEGKCPCSGNADCSGLGDLCSGTFYCDQSDPTRFTCKINPSTIVLCPANDTQCIVNECNPLSGTCSPVASKDGGACEAGICTKSDTCQSGGCVAGVDICVCQSASDCEDPDNNLCTGVPYCKTSLTPPFECLNSPKSVVYCPSGNDTGCKENTCDPLSGGCSMVNVANGASCDDGDPCTGDDSVAQGDQCQNGLCVGGSNFCECKTHSDCVDPDSDVCTGTPVCIDNSCQNDLSTVITCQSVNDTACSKNTCNGTTGACAMVAQTGDSCDDSDICSTGTTCTAAGVCGASLGDPCECMKDSDCTDPDNDVCTGVPYCNKDTSGPYECVNNPATVVSCTTGNDTSCLENTCNASTGACSMLSVNNGGSCDADSNPCTANDTCSFGSCVAGSNACACTQNSDCQDDGNLCNGSPYCNKSGFPYECVTNPATVVNCSSAGDTTCSANTCNASTGQCETLAINEGGSCDADGNACTAADLCSSGTCVPGADTCACTENTDCPDDGDLCNGTPYCDKSGPVNECKTNPASVVTCSTANDTTCSQAQCIPGLGTCEAVAVNDGGGCEADGQSCTTDTCSSGLCVEGPATSCVACTGTNDCAGLDCGGTPFFCNGAVCSCAVQCASSADCKRDSDPQCDGSVCAAEGYCQYLDASDTTVCDLDGLACTADSCLSGVCTAGTNSCP